MTLTALEDAIARIGHSLLVLSATYTNLAFGQRCKAMEARTRMGNAGEACDNTMAASFFVTLECGLIAFR